ncbi:MAG: hypothetical protein WA705_06725 [Candidatus Ozemobacteraceae bacterium]
MPIRPLTDAIELREGKEYVVQDGDVLNFLFNAPQSLLNLPYVVQ